MAEKHVIIGTAGHVDHGKTTLIKALTGLDTDRLKEEKERGMTIDLGFASLTLPGGRRVGIVDVPGHERFLKNMLAGATGVDLVLLVIAADEGVMPQTREHLEILQLLEAGQGVIALTKSDTVDEEWLEVVEEDIRQSLSGTFLSDVPIIRVDSLSNKGIDDLRKLLASLADEVEERTSSGPFRLPIDRVFTLTGFGTVVTGTLVSGTIRVGDAAEVLPEGLSTRIRQIQVHGAKQDHAVAGSRVAINLAGVEVEDLSRGSVLIPPGYLKASRLIDVEINLLGTASDPLRSRTRIRLHIGTAEVLGRLKILDAEEIQPGGEGLAQFTAEGPIVSARGDRFVIRSYSPMRTIGGGIVLDPNAPKRRRFDPKSIEALKTRLQGVPIDIVEDALLSAPGGVGKKELIDSTGLTDDVITESLSELSDSNRARRIGRDRWLHNTIYSQILSRIESELEVYHQANPYKTGMPREDLRITAARAMDVRTFGSLLAALEETGQVKLGEIVVKLPTHEVTLGDVEQQEFDRIEGAFRSAGLNVPSPEDITSGKSLANDMFALLVERGKLIKIDEGLYFHADVIAETRQALTEFLNAKGQMTVSEFRDLTGSSRKYVVPLLEYFDSIRITRRVGDARVLAK